MELEPDLLVLEDGLSELRKFVGPNVRTRHNAVIGQVGVVGCWIQCFPTNLVPLMHIAHILWVIVAT